MVMGVAGCQQKEQKAFLTNQTLEFGFKKAREKTADERFDFISLGIRFEFEE